jgi:hypothetical protein
MMLDAIAFKHRCNGVASISRRSVDRACRKQPLEARNPSGVAGGPSEETRNYVYAIALKWRRTKLSA